MAKRVRISDARAVARLLMAVAVAIVVLLVPRAALARDYSIDRVDIEATVGTDGSVSVKEVREFDFDGSFHGVYWEIPTGYYQGRDIQTTVLSVGEVINGSYVEFTEGYSGAEHTYELSEYSTFVRVKLYSSHADERAQFAIVYRDTDLATRYDDTAELYWKFVSDGWDVESKNVTCTVRMPVPGGQEVVGGSNVRAWGHGPLDATVSFANGDVVYEVPGVGTDEFAEARIAFPADWLSDAESVGYPMLDAILSEEQAWADAANARRARARALVGGSCVVGVVAPLASLAYAVVKFRRYKAAHKPQFDDRYFRDVPSADHPAVLGALLNGGSVTDECLTASLMRLTDQGNARLDLVKYRKRGLMGRERERETYSLTAVRFPAPGETNATRIDHKTMSFIFSDVAPRGAAVTGDPSTLFFDQLEAIARTYPESYDSALKGWRGFVEGECLRRGFLTEEGGTGRAALWVLGVLDVVIACAAFFVLLIMGVSLWVTLGICALCGAAGAATMVMASRMHERSPEAVELVAKLKALRRWLKEFTRLDEAIPQDVVLWNRLLVMAVVLGVSDEVIKQLRVAAPHLLESDALRSTYGWYYRGGPSLPASSFTSAVGSAHSVSAAKLAASSDSGGSGGGGGFSGGGGGGFGGGGGGGAF